MTTIISRQTPSVHTEAKRTPTVILQIGDSLARLTAHQARQLASMLVVQADAAVLEKTDVVDSLLVDGWIAKPTGFRGRTQRNVLLACRHSKLMLRGGKAT